MRTERADERRARALDRLASGPLDLLVVGAGIVGSRVALDAARAGLRVGLVDARDFAGATSSVSAKLIHGGFRYLSTGRPDLVRAARLEQDALCARVAPHLTRRLPMVLALDKETAPGGSRSPPRCGPMTPSMGSGRRVDGCSPPRPRRD